MQQEVHAIRQELRGIKMSLGALPNLASMNTALLALLEPRWSSTKNTPYLTESRSIVFKEMIESRLQVNLFHHFHNFVC